MSPKSKQEYFEALHRRYKEASRKENIGQSLILKLLLLL